MKVYIGLVGGREHQPSTMWSRCQAVFGSNLKCRLNRGEVMTSYENTWSSDEAELATNIIGGMR